jgi:hypothetical protein
MNNADYGKLTRKQLLEQMETERQEWLLAGMSEANVYRIHFGEEKENGRGGDYAAWLSERKHFRADHKYAPGVPMAIDAVDPDGARISGGRNDFDDAERNIDFEKALSMLTGAQNELLRAIVYEGATPAEYARDKHINKSVVSRTLERARKNLKKFFGEGN